MSKKNPYLKFVDMTNLTKQKCDTSDFQVSYIMLETIDPNDQECHFLVWTLPEKTEITYEKKIEASIPTYMYQLLKDEKFCLKNVLLSKQKPNRILQIEGIFKADKKLFGVI